LHKAHLREILSEACQGIFRGSIIKDFISPNSWYIESLNLVLNTGNGWLEVARNCFQYLLTLEGKVQDRTIPGNQPNEREQAIGGSPQTKEWRQTGLDYQKIVEDTVGGRSMCRPLTKYHGSQVERIFSGQDGQTEHRLLSKGIAVRARDKEAVPHLLSLSKRILFFLFRLCLEELRACLELLATVHQQVSIARPDTEVLEVAVESFKDSFLFFVVQQLQLHAVAQQSLMTMQSWTTLWTSAIGCPSMDFRSPSCRANSWN
jgi:hypothetical protein